MCGGSETNKDEFKIFKLNVYKSVKSLIFIKKIILLIFNFKAKSWRKKKKILTESIFFKKEL